MGGEGGGGEFYEVCAVPVIGLEYNIISTVLYMVAEAQFFYSEAVGYGEGIFPHFLNPLIDGIPPHL